MGPTIGETFSIFEVIVDVLSVTVLIFYLILNGELIVKDAFTLL